MAKAGANAFKGGGYSGPSSQSGLARGGGTKNNKGYSSLGGGMSTRSPNPKTNQYTGNSSSGSSSSGSSSSGKGGYSGGGGGASGGGYVEPAPAPEPTVDYAAYMQMLLKEQQRIYDEQMKKLKASTDAANQNIDQNAQNASGRLEAETAEQLRQANISRQRAVRDFPQSSLVSGGGGMSESGLMEVENTYQNSRDRYGTALTNASGDIMNQANTLKAQNSQNLTQTEVDFMNQIPQYVMQLASMGPEYAKAGVNPMANLNFGGTTYGATPQEMATGDARQGISSPSYGDTLGNTMTYAKLKAQGYSDEQIKQMLGG